MLRSVADFLNRTEDEIKRALAENRGILEQQKTLAEYRALVSIIFETLDQETLHEELRQVVLNNYVTSLLVLLPENSGVLLGGCLYYTEDSNPDELDHYDEVSLDQYGAYLAHSLGDSWEPVFGTPTQDE